MREPVHHGARRPAMQLLLEELELAVLSRRDHFDGAVREIPHPAAETEPPGLLTHEPAKPDPLHESGDSDVQLAHSSRQPCVPMSGTKRTGRMLSRTISFPWRVNITNSCSSGPP